MNSQAAHKSAIAMKYRELEVRCRLFKELMDGIPDVIYFKDKKGRLILVNQAHARGLGLKPEEVAGKSDFDIFSKERARVMLKDDRRVITSGRPIIDKIERATRPDGIDNYVSTTKIPRFDSRGRVIGLIGITRDITRRIHLEYAKEEKLRLKKKIEALEELNRLKSEFISVVSHELRTPLAIVKEAIGLVSDEITGPLSAKQKDILSKAVHNINRLRNLIDELLDMSRIESGTFKLRYSLVNLNELLRESSEFFRQQARGKGINLECSLPESETNIFIDAERLTQAVANLLSNAVKFTEEAGRITLELEVLESKVRVGVVDTGIGIAKQDLSKLFHKFVQLAKVPGAERKGLGLGLSIVKEIINRHGGEIWAESKAGVGSRFYFTLPRFYSLDALGSDNRQEINSLLSQGKKVYFVNITVVNYPQFRQRLRLLRRRFLREFKSAVQGALGEVRPLKQGPPPIVCATQIQNLNIIFTEARENNVLSFCAVLKERLNGYFSRSGIRDVFVSSGVISYSRKSQPPLSKNFPANLIIKEIYIGSDIRRFPRICYQAQVDILWENQARPARSVDITEQGICFNYDRPLQTDASLKLRLRLLPKNPALELSGRVAWLRELINGPAVKYKVGVEFTNIKPQDRACLGRFIRGHLLGRQAGG